MNALAIAAGFLYGTWFFSCFLYTLGYTVRACKWHRPMPNTAHLLLKQRSQAKCHQLLFFCLSIYPAHKYPKESRLGVPLLAVALGSVSSRNTLERWSCCLPSARLKHSLDITQVPTIVYQEFSFQHSSSTSYLRERDKKRRKKGVGKARVL